MLFYAILNECRFCIMQYVVVVAKKQKIKKTIKFICEILKKTYIFAIQFVSCKGVLYASNLKLF